MNADVVKYTEYGQPVSAFSVEETPKTGYVAPDFLEIGKLDQLRGGNGNRYQDVKVYLYYSE